MKHFYSTIPGWFSFATLYKRAVAEAEDGDHFVEIGSWKGRSAAFMAVEIANSGKRIRFDCVDTWKGSNEPKHQADLDVQSKRLFQIYLRNIAPVRHLIKVVRMPSVAASAHYLDDGLKFVFIDAAHDYASVTEDIAAWYPKVKVGGLLAGDDYNKREVAKAVEDFFLSATVEPGKGSGIQWLVRKSVDHDRRVAVAG